MDLECLSTDNEGSPTSQSMGIWPNAGSGSPSMPTSVSGTPTNDANFSPRSLARSLVASGGSWASPRRTSVPANRFDDGSPGRKSSFRSSLGEFPQNPQIPRNGSQKKKDRSMSLPFHQAVPPGDLDGGPLSGEAHMPMLEKVGQMLRSMGPRSFHWNGAPLGLDSSGSASPMTPVTPTAVPAARLYSPTLRPRDALDQLTTIGGRGVPP